MNIKLPCRLGEEFTLMEFDRWENGKRVYRNTNIKSTLKGFDKFIPGNEINSKSHLTQPTIHHSMGLSIYDEEYGNFLKYSIYIPDYMFIFGKLEEKGFKSRVMGRLSGIDLTDGVIMADIITAQNYSHMKMKYPLEIEYEPLQQAVDNLIPELEQEHDGQLRLCF